MQPLSPSEYVIGLFGGLTGTSAAISVPVTTVQGWKERGRIPQDYWFKLIDAAVAKGKRLAVDDFLHAHSEAA